jgi:hypothetical protein
MIEGALLKPARLIGCGASGSLFWRDESPRCTQVTEKCILAFFTRAAQACWRREWWVSLRSETILQTERGTGVPGGQPRWGGGCAGS